MEIKQKDDGSIEIYTPYNKEFVKKIKLIGGAKWNSNKNCWITSDSDIEIVRDIMIQVYGESDICKEETVDIKVITKSKISEKCSGIEMFSRVIAVAYGRDSGANVGGNVTFIEGEVKSTGSSKNWYTTISEDSMFIIKNVPKSIWERDKNKYLDCCDVIIVESEDNKKQALIKERDALLKRISDIDNLLKNL